MCRLPAILLAAMPVLALADDVSETRLRAHVERLAGDIGERNVWRPQALARAEDYIRRAFESSGYRVKVQELDYQERRVANVEAARPGTTRAQEIVVVGAHYDSVQVVPEPTTMAAGWPRCSNWRVSSPSARLLAPCASSPS